MTEIGPAERMAYLGRDYVAAVGEAERARRRARRFAGLLVLAAMLGWHWGAPRDSNR